VKKTGGEWRQVGGKMDRIKRRKVVEMDRRREGKVRGDANKAENK